MVDIFASQWLLGKIVLEMSRKDLPEREVELSEPGNGSKVFAII